MREHNLLSPQRGRRGHPKGEAGVKAPRSDGHRGLGRGGRWPGPVAADGPRHPGRVFQNLEAVRRAVRHLGDTYNREWRVAKNGLLSPWQDRTQ